MQASTYNKYGNPNVLEIKQVEIPQINEKELLVKVYAATVNRTDCASLRAKPFIMRFVNGLLKPKKRILGSDFAGVVEKVGIKVTEYAIGDKVFGFEDIGVSSHAQYLAISEDKAISIMPEKIPFDEAVSCLEGTHYAYNMINKTKLELEQNVLVIGGTGAIGSAAIQLLTYFGVNVTAVGDPKNLELMLSLGAKRALDYTTSDFTKEPYQYSHIFDCVGKSSFGMCKPILLDKGVYISSELGKFGENIFFAMFTPWLGSKKVIFPIPSKIKDSVLLVKRLIEEGKYQAVIDRKYPLNETVEAFTYVLKGQKIGNVVLFINN